MHGVEIERIVRVRSVAFEYGLRDVVRNVVISGCKKKRGGQIRHQRIVFPLLLNDFRGILDIPLDHVPHGDDDIGLEQVNFFQNLFVDARHVPSGPVAQHDHARYGRLVVGGSVIGDDGCDREQHQD